jgi:hypothetical protein
MTGFDYNNGKKFASFWRVLFIYVKVLVINDPDIGKCIENNENKSLHLSQFK